MTATLDLGHKGSVCPDGARGSRATSFWSQTTTTLSGGAILDISAARNNNVQLKLDTKANQAGHYHAIKEALDPKLARDVVWKTNEPGRIPARDIVALGWIPLAVLTLPEGCAACGAMPCRACRGHCPPLWCGPQIW
jgi:hypothetical protein